MPVDRAGRCCGFEFGVRDLVLVQVGYLVVGGLVVVVSCGGEFRFEPVEDVFKSPVTGLPVVAIMRSSRRAVAAAPSTPTERPRVIQPPLLQP
jgi:hypothetical protein